MRSFHTFSILFFLRENRSNEKREAAIYLRITVDGQRTEVATKNYTDSKKWQPGKGRIKGNSEEIRTTNNNLDVWEMKAQQHYTEFLSSGKLITAAAIKKALLGLESKEYSLIKVFAQHTEEMNQMAGIDFRKETGQSYRTTLRYLQEFLESQMHTSDVFLKQLDHKFITDLEFWLKTSKGCRNNGALKHISRLKKVISICIRNGWLERNPFANYKLAKEKSNRVYLSEEELDTIVSKEFKIERLQLVKDMFVFTCYTGLAFIDLKELTPDNIRIGIDGDKWIFTERSKTGIPSNVPLLQPALDIIEKYADHPAAKNKGLLLPVLSNQKMNAYLKEIGDICGITKEITCHMGRHTFATTVTLTNNVPIESVSKMLGHTNLKTTQIYAKILDQKVGHDMSRLKEKLFPNFNQKSVG